MKLNILFQSICDDLNQSKEEVRIPPNQTATVTEEDGLKIVAFVADGMEFEGRYKNHTLWVVRPDGTFVASTDGNRILNCNPDYRILL
jgi:hypothetical protein